METKLDSSTVEFVQDFGHWLFGINFGPGEPGRYYVAIHFGPWCVIKSWEMA